jgi:hypothetical protein
MNPIEPTASIEAIAARLAIDAQGWCAGARAFPRRTTMRAPKACRSTCW